MSYRDDLESALQHVADLERELEQLKAETRAEHVNSARIDELEAQLGHYKRDASKHALVRRDHQLVRRERELEAREQLVALREKQLRKVKLAAFIAVTVGTVLVFFMFGAR